MDMALAALASAQHAVFGLDQLRALGLHERAIQKRADVGRFHRIHHTVYSLVPKALLKREGLYMAAVLACGPGAVLSHRSAARLHGLRDWGHTKIEVTVPGRSARTHSGVAVHRSTTLTDADATVADGIPVTSVHRTLFDVAEVVTQRQLERAFDQAEILEALDLNAINDQLARNPTRPGAKKVRKLLAEHYIGSTAT
ncbi:MAG TPA: type IV toxin-antitoxin system AbiEi family antitoxin domain-containing protein, partial [Solirubrobacteraceae bacterium]